MVFNNDRRWRTDVATTSRRVRRKPVAGLVAVKKVRKKRELGFLTGKLRVPDDFDAPLPDAVLAEFER
jgi:antitoxin (DNA-binding transcriptional repressor) of toxin-antitoxin stability system